MSDFKTSGNQRPVQDLDLSFEWQTNTWKQIFDEQITVIRQDLTRAKAENRLVIYLSCPISSRGGGYHLTNVDVVKHIERTLLNKWGHRFWILNPANYQMESLQGTGLINQHIRNLGLERKLVDQLPKPIGGDYMRMWTKVLAEDGQDNCGRNFDGYYFIGPNDVHDFFYNSGATTISAAVEDYFSRKMQLNQDFKRYFSESNGEISAERTQRFFRFYAIQASAFFSLGCHDEWHIFRLLNQKRLQQTTTNSEPSGDTGELLAGYFDGKQINPTVSDEFISKGYAGRL